MKNFDKCLFLRQIFFLIKIGMLFDLFVLMNEGYYTLIFI